MSPAAIVRTAADRKLQAIALPDHDTVDGIDAALQAGSKYQMEIIPGIELTSHYQKKSLHILGYGMDHQHPAFCHGLEQVQIARKVRNQKIIEKLNKLDIHITAKEVAEVSGSGQTGRPHFARLLIKKGVTGSINEAFHRYLGGKGKAFVARKRLPAEEAIKMIHGAGGAAVLAHPFLADRSMNMIPDLLHDLKELDLDGVEVFYPSQPNRVRQLLLQLCNNLKLVITGGSDYHGEGQSKCQIIGGNGKDMVSAALLADLKKIINIRQKTCRDKDLSTNGLQE